TKSQAPNTSTRNLPIVHSTMPKVQPSRRSKQQPPEGWSDLEPRLDEFKQKMRD
ncbi:hypothetical protein GGH17_005034, partial [Coemansia sp. RSA 788]